MLMGLVALSHEQANVRITEAARRIFDNWNVSKEVLGMRSYGKTQPIGTVVSETAA